MIILNFKTYTEATANNRSVELALICQEVFENYHVPIILGVQATDLYKISKVTSLPLFIQHIDYFEPGKHTGYITALAARENGATGVIINHSEHRIGNEAIEKTISAAANENLQTLVCVENAHEAQCVDQWQPTMIALEDPVLIGGNESIVVNNEGKQKVNDFVHLKLGAKPLVGAGVKNKDDVSISLQLGAYGVLLASGFTLASNPKEVLINLCEGFK